MSPERVTPRPGEDDELFAQRKARYAFASQFGSELIAQRDYGEFIKYAVTKFKPILPFSNIIKGYTVVVCTN
jgi:hypothetical protein